MRTRAMTPELTAALRSLAEVQLQIQASRSATLDARAIGVIGVDAAVTTFTFGAVLGLGPRIAALAHKASRLTAAFVVLALAIAIALVGGVH